MSCHDTRNLIVKQLAAGVDASEAATLRLHLSECEGCRRYRADSAAAWSELDALQEDAGGTSCVREIMARIASASSARAARVLPDDRESWRSRALSAVVMLALVVGLFAMVVRRGPEPVKVHSSVAGEGDKDADAPKPVDPDFGLTPAELEAIAQCIKELDAEEFDVREAAAKKLVAMGVRIKPFLAARLKDLKVKDSAEQHHQLIAIVGQIERVAAEKVVDETLKSLKLAVDEAPSHFMPPDTRTAEKLQTPVTFNFVDANLKDCIAYVSEQADVPVVIDPELNADLNLTNINLRVTQMKAKLSLEWMARLTNFACVVRGGVAVITNPAKAAKLSLELRSYPLPVAQGELPWSDAEAKQLFEFFGAGETPVTVSEQDRSEGVRIIPHNRAVEVCIAHEKQQAVEAFIQALNEESVAPPQASGLEESLDKKIHAEMDHASFEEAALFLSEQSLVSIGGRDIRTYRDIDANIDYHGPEATIRDLLLLVCDKANLAILPCEDHLTWSVTPPYFTTLQLCNFNLKSALNAKVPLADLLRCFDEICKPLGKTVNSVCVRGHWHAWIDPWTGERIKRVIEQAAKTGRIPDVSTIPVPWFFKTFVRRPDPPMPPAVTPSAPARQTMDVDSYGDDGKVIRRCRLKN